MRRRVTGYPSRAVVQLDRLVAVVSLIPQSAVDFRGPERHEAMVQGFQPVHEVSRWNIAAWE